MSEMIAAVDSLWAEAENSVEYWQEKARLLEAENEALKQAAEWVPITERLPDVSVDILAGGYDDNGIWQQEIGFRSISGEEWVGFYFEPSHWKPLSAPPSAHLRQIIEGSK